MELLISHWHCILPIAGIMVAVFLLRDKSEKKGGDKNGEK